MFFNLIHECFNHLLSNPVDNYTLWYEYEIRDDESLIYVNTLPIYKRFMSSEFNLIIQSCFVWLSQLGCHDMSSIVTSYDIRSLSFMQEQQALLQDWDYEQINILRNNQRYN